MTHWASVLDSPSAICWKWLLPFTHSRGQRAMRSGFPVLVKLHGYASSALLLRQPSLRCARRDGIHSSFPRPPTLAFTGFSRMRWEPSRLRRSYSPCLTARLQIYFAATESLKPSAFCCLCLSARILSFATRAFHCSLFCSLLCY